jgi:hypothetical protein
VRRGPYLLGTLALAAANAVLLPPGRAGAASETPLIAAVRNGDTQAVQALLKGHADVNGRQGDGATALHWAAHLDDLRTAQLLMQGQRRSTSPAPTAAPRWWGRFLPPARIPTRLF